MGLLLLALALVVVSVEGHSHGHDHHESHSHSHHSHSHSSPAGQKKRSASSVWPSAVVATILVGCAPILVLFFLPLGNGNENGNFLRVLLGFAAGGLLGDVFLHLLPHALDPHDDHHHDGHTKGNSNVHDHSRGLWIGLFVLAGILAFFAIDKWVRAKAASFGSGARHAHTHAHAHHDDDPAAKKSKPNRQKSNAIAGVEVTGWLNLVADFSHNFTDGLAIGASFLASERLGYVTTLAVLIHEVPHEIGDFAILIKSGMSRRGAMLAQLGTALGCLAGTFVGLLAHNVASSTGWILPFTAGGFVYIACTTVLPDLLQDEATLGQSVKEIVAAMVGIALMVLVALIE